jgi:hypothetical protein
MYTRHVTCRYTRRVHHEFKHLNANKPKNIYGLLSIDLYECKSRKIKFENLNTALLFPKNLLQERKLDVKKTAQCRGPWEGVIATNEQVSCYFYLDVSLFTGSRVGLAAMNIGQHS